MSCEQLLKQAFAEAAAIKLAQIPDTRHIFSAGYKRRKRELLKSLDKVHETAGQMRHTGRFRLKYLWLAIILAAVTALTGSFLVWYHIAGFTFRREQTNSTVYVDSMEDPKTTIKEIYFIPDSVGVEIKKQSITSGSVLTKYQIGNNQIILDQTLITDKQQINTEGYLIEEVQIGENNGYFIKMDNNSFVSWTMDGYVFSITSDLNKEDVLNLAKMTIF